MKTLLDAIEADNARETSLQLSRARDVRAWKGEGGKTLLHIACLWASAPVVEVLVSGGVPIDALNDDGFPPVADAVARGDVEIVRVLMAGGANVRFRDDDAETLVM